MSAHDHSKGAWHGTSRDYIIGFVASILLTAVPFWLVMSGAIDSKQATAFLIVAFAAVQMLVHVRFFLHVSANSESGWTLLSLLFTLTIVVITLAGALWIMHHLDGNMMPAQEMSGLP